MSFPYSTNGGNQCYKASSLALLYFVPDMRPYIENAIRAVARVESNTKPPDAVISAIRMFETVLMAFDAWNRGKRYMMRDSGPQEDAAEYVAKLMSGIEACYEYARVRPLKVPLSITQETHDDTLQKTINDVKTSMMYYNVHDADAFDKLLLRKKVVTDKKRNLTYTYSLNTDTLLVVFVPEVYSGRLAGVTGSISQSKYPVPCLTDANGKTYILQCMSLRTRSNGTGGHYLFALLEDSQWWLYDSLGTLRTPLKTEQKMKQTCFGKYIPRLCLYKAASLTRKVHKALPTITSNPISSRPITPKPNLQRPLTAQPQVKRPALSGTTQTSRQTKSIPIQGSSATAVRRHSAVSSRLRNTMMEKTAKPAKRALPGRTYLEQRQRLFQRFLGTSLTHRR